jgi:16S rRNA (cytosine1402-N4)-methyltransferase
MRMDQQQGLDAREVVNDYELPALKRVLLRGGVGASSGRIARVLVDSRPIESTTQLALACQQALRFETPATVRQTTTVIFQAIRIEVNDELGEIERLLDAIPEHLAPGGTAAVISFHSSEDRLVASRMRDWSRPKQPLRDIPQADIPPLGELVTAKALVPSQEEIARNPRARSARLRIFRRGDRGNNQVQYNGYGQ